MATSALTMSKTGGWLNDHQLSALSGSVSAILEQISPRLKSDTDASDAISAIACAARSAYADFAGRFNESNPRAVTSRLPISVLIAVLYEADMPTRIRASHASHALRDIALAEPGLWTVYCHAGRRPGQEQSLDFLEAILHRSDPLPLRLDMKYLFLSDGNPLVSKLAAMISPSLHRLQRYQCRHNTVSLLNPAEIPLRMLVSLELTCMGLPSDPLEHCVLRSECLPNLHSLFAPGLMVSVLGQPIYSLRELECTMGTEGSQVLFRSFPNLVRAVFHGSRDGPLPPGPIPRSIEKIRVVCGGYGFDPAALRVWAGETIPRLELIDAQILDVVGELLAAQAGPTVATMSSRWHDYDVILSDAAEPSRWCWAIWTEFFWLSKHTIDNLRCLFTAVQIVSLTIPTGIFMTEFYTPHLRSLELRLTGAFDTTPSTCSLRAPFLQHFVLDFETNPEGDVYTDFIRAEFEALSQNFRQIIVYDADLLETVTVRSSSRPPEGMDCSCFARFAQRYIDLTCH